ncbi:MAG: nitrous oxide reductase family maturation protein NosD [Chloroflexi bacterium]|nr:nitrous oxide reductase family maturation protein NosD [Chloroflexota bacterium]
MNKLNRRGLAWLLVALVFGLPGIAGASHAQQAPAAAIRAEELPAAIAAAGAGDTIEVNGGTLYGSLQIDRPLTLVGRNFPVLDGQNEGTVLEISAPGSSVEGFLIRNSGDSLDQENSGIVVEATGVNIRNNRFEDTLFGIYLRKAHGSTVHGNVIQGKDLDVPRRGDAIRVWYSNDVSITENRVERGRDVVLWYSERLTVRGNDVSDGRYGLHFMYCDDAMIEENRLRNNSVGAFLMYSRRMTMQHNTVAGNRGPSGFGVGLKDMDDAIVVENLFLDNRVGAYLDGSPREVDSIGRFEGNVFAYNDIGVELLPAVRHNEFVNNSFIDNGEHVAIAGGGRPGENAWTVAGAGNFWSDYAGFDADRDGRGDVTYRSQRLFEDLMQREPALRLFLYSPATDALDFAARAFPAVRPQPKLEDSAPLMAPVMPAGAPTLPDARGDAGWLWLALALVGFSAGLGALPWLRRRRYSLPQPQPLRARISH